VKKSLMLLCLISLLGSSLSSAIVETKTAKKQPLYGLLFFLKSCKTLTHLTNNAIIEHPQAFFITGIACSGLGAFLFLRGKLPGALLSPGLLLSGTLVALEAWTAKKSMQQENMEDINQIVKEGKKIVKRVWEPFQNSCRKKGFFKTCGALFKNNKLTDKMVANAEDELSLANMRQQVYTFLRHPISQIDSTLGECIKAIEEKN
jgi:hypothetical protein